MSGGALTGQVASQAPARLCGAVEETPGIDGLGLGATGTATAVIIRNRAILMTNALPGTDDGEPSEHGARRNRGAGEALAGWTMQWLGQRPFDRPAGVETPAQRGERDYTTRIRHPLVDPFRFAKGGIPAAVGEVAAVGLCRSPRTIVGTIWLVESNTDQPPIFRVLMCQRPVAKAGEILAPCRAHRHAHCTEDRVIGVPRLFTGIEHVAPEMMQATTSRLVGTVRCRWWCRRVHR